MNTHSEYLNQVQDYSLEHVETFYNNATIYHQAAHTRIDAYFCRLTEEIEHNVRVPVSKELKEYVNRPQGAKTLIDILTEDGFSPFRAQRVRDMINLFLRTAKKYASHPSAQKILLLLFARIRNEFYTSISGLIDEGESPHTIMEYIRTKIVLPIMDTLNTNGAHDLYLNFTEDHIYGMIFLLM